MKKEMKKEVKKGVKRREYEVAYVLENSTKPLWGCLSPGGDKNFAFAVFSETH
jgi:hypothetical protein